METATQRAWRILQASVRAAMISMSHVFKELFALLEYGLFGAHCIDFDSTSSPKIELI